MTNIGGPGFLVVIFALFVTAGAPVFVGISLLLIRWERMHARRAFLVTNGAAIGAGLVVLLAWAAPSLGEGTGPYVLQLLLVFLGTALSVVIVLELLPIWVGTVVLTRRYAVPVDRAVVFVAIGWIVGVVVGIGLTAIVVPSIMAAVGAVPGALVGAAVLGPVLYRFTRG